MIYFLVILIMIAGIYLPWWFCGFICFAFGWLANSPRKTLLGSFVGVFAAWVIAAHYFDINNALSTSHRLTLLLGLPHFVLVYLVVGSIGGVYGASAGLCAVYLRRLLSPANVCPVNFAEAEREVF
ncbi:MAG: hypothetical protein IPK68_21880 [Bdellovibrionales bacterium]|nr:hypothetical protein [Bdellovibrionales bacterium]